MPNYLTKGFPHTFMKRHFLYAMSVSSLSEAVLCCPHPLWDKYPFSLSLVPFPYFLMLYFGSNSLPFVPLAQINLLCAENLILWSSQGLKKQLKARFSEVFT